MLENLLQLFTSFIGFIVVALILFRYKTNRIANIYLVLLILLMTFRYFINGFVLIDKNSFIINLFDDFQNIQMLIYPLTYLYFKNLICNDKKIEYNDLIHFVVLIFLYVTDRILINFSIYSTKTVYNLYLIYYLGYTIIYLLLIYKLVINKIWKKKGLIVNNRSQNKLLKKWSLYLTSVILFISIRNIILIILLLLSIKINNYFLWISVIVFLILFFKILISPEILYGYDFIIQKIENNKQSIIAIKSLWSLELLYEVTNLQDLKLKGKIDDKLLTYFSLIDNISDEATIFRDPKFSMDDFARFLKIPKSHLTYLFKYHSNITFPDLKKMIRIKDSVKLIETGFLNSNTLLTLSKTVGFFTYAPFFHSFKELTNLNPIEYSKNLHNLNS